MVRPTTAALHVLTVFVLAAAAPAVGARDVALGSRAPELELETIDGSSFSLADIDGPAVLIFYRGLW